MTTFQKSRINLNNPALCRGPLRAVRLRPSNLLEAGAAAVGAPRKEAFRA